MSRKAAGNQTRRANGVRVPRGTVLRTQCATELIRWYCAKGVGVPPGTVLRTQCATDIYRPGIAAVRIGSAAARIGAYATGKSYVNPFAPSRVT
jgi:hypothetical protein